MKIREANSGDVGTSRELIVAADLLKHGFEVFKALSGTASVDLVVLLKTRTFRVEVKGEFTKADIFPVSRHIDLLAVVGSDGNISYFSFPGYKKFNPELQNSLGQHQETECDEKGA